jgi:hypothetical protein
MVKNPLELNPGDLFRGALVFGESKELITALQVLRDSEISPDSHSAEVRLASLSIVQDHWRQFWSSENGQAFRLQLEDREMQTMRRPHIPDDRRELQSDLDIAS